MIVYDLRITIRWKFMYSYCLIWFKILDIVFVFTDLNLIEFICIQKMRYVAAYLLAALGGNENPNAENIEKILSSVGIEAESDKLSKVIAELKGKSLQTLIAEGNHY